MFKQVKRVLSAAAVAALTTGVLTQAPAQASTESSNSSTNNTASRCSLTMSPKLAITSPFREVTVRTVTDCTLAPRTVYASWDAVSSQGTEDIVIFDNTSVASFDLYDWDTLGQWKWRPMSAWDTEFNGVPQNTVYTMIKRGSRSSLAVTRSGSRVSLSTGAAYYNTDARRFVAWPNATVQLQWKYPGTTIWYALRTFKTNASGMAYHTYTNSASRDYRAYVPGNGWTWEAVSGTVRK